MRFGIFTGLVLALLTLAARADEKIPILTAGNVTYSNITVTTVSATDIYFTYSGGMGNVKLKNLSPDLQQHFHFDTKKASEVELLQATNKLKYHEQLLHEPTAKPPDMTREAPKLSKEAAEFLDIISPFTQAREEHKYVLVTFTGSDWDQETMRFEKDVMASEAFAGYAKTKLIIVRMDSPRHSPQLDLLKDIHEETAKKFHIDHIPTYLLLGADTKELGRQVGYLEGGPDAFIAKLDGFIGR